jgi:hypothetical protein
MGYYLITFQTQWPLTIDTTTTVIDMSPIEFRMKFLEKKSCSSFIILFVMEITKEEFEKCDGRASTITQLKKEIGFH